jgi:hypothetical protein
MIKYTQGNLLDAPADGENLKLDFKAHHEGPYSVQLSHVYKHPLKLNTTGLTVVRCASPTGFSVQTGTRSLSDQSL